MLFSTQSRRKIYFLATIYVILHCLKAVWRNFEKDAAISFFMAKSFILSCTFSIESIHFCIIRHIIHRRRPYAGVVNAEIEFQISINNRFWIVSLWMQIEKQMTISILVILNSIKNVFRKLMNIMSSNTNALIRIYL